MSTSAPSETYNIKNDLKIIERFFTVPLDHANPEGEKIHVFARNVIPKAKAKTAEDEAKLPFLVYLQGGPGFEIDLPRSSGYAGELHEKGYQTLWVDQRGTGLSTPLSPDTLPAHVKTDQEIANYLKFFRADSIVKDCEVIRKQLLGHKESPEDRKWTLMGQSFGGFCAITYLSFHPEGVKEVFLTGGLAPLVDQPDIVYEALAKRVIKRNTVYYEKYPQDVKRVRDILTYLEANKVILPNGGRLTPCRWQQLGMSFGMHGGIDNVHQLVFRASKEIELLGKLSYKLLQSVGNQPFDGNPLYAILHEPVYCQGKPANWSASRIIQKYEQFSWTQTRVREDDTPVYFTGEMIFPDMFKDYANLRPWAGAAEILAKDADWPPLYDLKQLSKNEVPVSAVTYFNDMYVDFDFAQDTASKIKNTEQYITNQLVHDGIREDSSDVMKKLFKLSKREFD
ncbi:alpha/beta-hydrolase [Pholiota conissans]|uniref:Alpha/beta-hydrolase n=1 Tax=Pholiota conissans TaxID=109636 RepID=A0A9P5Z0H8_9AGAR|nr:alpha/beta-hydrolase [Pholiota conissans]